MLKALEQGMPVDAKEKEASIAYKALLFLLFIIYIAPQLMFEVLQPLSLGKLSAGIAIVVYLATTVTRRGRLSIMNTEVKLIFVLVMLTLVSIAYSQWPGGSFAFFLDFYSKSIIVFVLVLNLLTDFDRCRRMVWYLTIFSAFNAIVALNRYRQGEFFAGDRVYGGFSGLTGDPNDLAFSLVLAIPFMWFLFESSKKRAHKYLALACVCLSAAAIVVTFSRGGFLGLLAIFLWFAWIRVKEHGPAVIMMAIVVCALFVAIAPAGYSDRIVSIADSSKDYTGSGDMRWTTMKAAARIAIEHPFGAGLKMHNVLLPSYGAGWQGVHSAFLEVAADIGLLGGVVFTLVCWRLLKAMRQMRRSPDLGDSQLKRLGEATEISLIGFLTSGMFLAVAYLFPFYILAGLALALRQLALKEKTFRDSQAAGAELKPLLVQKWAPAK
jgi:putative inorganic carbon (HCO3(-)) transporter